MKEELEKVKSLLANIIVIDSAGTEGPWRSGHRYERSGELITWVGTSHSDVVCGGKSMDTGKSDEQHIADASSIVLNKTYSAPMAKALLGTIERLEGTILFESLLQSIISTILKNTERSGASSDAAPGSTNL